MKITCDSCGAKYTIADDKVSGRKVKIRCKGCGTPIVVDGAQPNAANGAAGDSHAQDVASAPPEALMGEWSVNLSETDQRTMTTQQLVEGWASGIVTSDAFVWKDGMADWVPVLECAELAPLLRAPKAAPVSARPTSARPAATTSRGGAGRAQAGADLFAAAAAAGDDLEEPPAMAPSFPQVGAQQEDARPTGARNENSVLFSLDALKAGFSGAAPSKNAPKSTPPGRSSSRPPAGDDPFGLGSAGRAAVGPMFSLADNNALLTAPAPPEPPPKPVIAYAEGGASVPAPGSKKGLILGIVAVLIVGGVGAAFALSAKKEKEEALQAAAAAAASAEQAREQAKEEERKARAAEERAREEQRSAEAHAQAAPPATAGEPSSKPEEAAEPGKSSGGAGAAAKKEPSGASAKKEEAKPKKEEPAAAPAGGGDQPFSKSAAISALGAAANGAAGCKKLGGPTGSGKVTVTFANSGRVTSANVSGGPFAGTSVGGCVASLFRKAKVPPFSGSPVTVSKSFSIN